MERICHGHCKPSYALECNGNIKVCISYAGAIALKCNTCIRAKQEKYNIKNCNRKKIHQKNIIQV